MYIRVCLLASGGHGTLPCCITVRVTACEKRRVKAEKWKGERKRDGTGGKKRGHQRRIEKMVGERQ